MDSQLLKLQSEGFIVQDVISDSRIKRVKDGEDDKGQAGWYVSYRNFSPTSGDEFYVLVYNSWKNSDSEPKHFCTLTNKLSKEDSKLIIENIKKAKLKSEKEKLKLQKEIAEEVQEKWNKLSTSGFSNYLKIKKIDSCSNLGIKFDSSKSVFYIPIRDIDGNIWSWQQINNDGTKFFKAGGRISGLFHIIGDVQLNYKNKIYVVEGFATGATVNIATDLPVCVAFNCGNIREVIPSLKQKYPEADIIICGDDDINTTLADGTPYNSGRVAAEKAVEQGLGTAVFPKFQSTAVGQFDNKPNDIPTDFNDLHILSGIEEVKSQLADIKILKKHFVRPLGHRGKDYFFTSSENRQIVNITNFSKRDLLDLMPLAFWETNYPIKNGVNWDEATNKLMQDCRKQGLFQHFSIRGAGVWMDEGRTVVNMGDHLIVDGKQMELTDIKSRFLYMLGTKLRGLPCKPLSIDECKIITNAASMFKWKKQDFAFLLAGAMVTTRVCGALPIRPHIWLTGEKGSGKTTLFNRFIDPLIGDPKIFAASNSTEAGIRQSLIANAVPVLFDEFESQGSKSAETIQTLLDLMRVAWSETNASIIKGGSSGTAQLYQARFAAIVTSIRQISMSDADRSRFATIELAPHENDLEHWKYLENLLNQIDKDFGNRLFARTISMMPILLENFKAMKKSLNKKLPGQRFGDQYGMLLAGYSILTQDQALSEEQADALASMVILDDAIEDTKTIDHQDCLMRLLTTTISTDGGKLSVLELIKQSADSNNGSDDIKRLGLGLRGDKLFIANESHTELQKIFKDSKWTEWSRSLRRLDDAYADKISLFGKEQRGTFVPLKYVFTD